MIPVPDDLPDDPVALKQLLAQLLAERTVDKDHIVDLKEQIKLWRDVSLAASPSKPSTPIRRNCRCSMKQKTNLCWP